MAGRDPADAQAVTEDRETAAAFLANGDEAAFRRLYGAHAPRLYLALLRLSGGREAAAEDLLQETWIRAASGLSGFGWRSSLQTWLYGIAVNVWRESVRRRAGADISLDAIPEEPASPTPHSGDERLDLERALRELPVAGRAVLLLHDVEGYTHEEIAGLLEISSGTSKSQLSRARERLRRRLGAVPAHAAAEEERT